jgi:hypothetical protein
MGIKKRRILRRFQKCKLTYLSEKMHLKNVIPKNRAKLGLIHIKSSLSQFFRNNFFRFISPQIKFKLLKST